MTNGSVDVLADVDRRSGWMRRLVDLRSLAEQHMGTDLTHPERVLADRASMLTLQAELLEAKWAGNDGTATAADLELYQRTVNALRRVWECLGTSRRMRDVTPLAEFRRLIEGKSATELDMIEQRIRKRQADDATSLRHVQIPGNATVEIDMTATAEQAMGGRSYAASLGAEALADFDKQARGRLSAEQYRRYRQLASAADAQAEPEEDEPR
ncbi:MAG TPA: hypothetical protein VJ890_05630 [Vineibacter sp.]|nr:hypothetical protein [Vineibacter sp.]